VPKTSAAAGNSRKRCTAMADQTNEFVRTSDTTNQQHSVLSSDFATSTPNELRQLTPLLDAAADKYVQPFSIKGLHDDHTIVPIIDIPQPRQTDDPMRQRDVPRGMGTEPAIRIDGVDIKPIVEFPFKPTTPADTHNIWNASGFVKPINPADARVDNVWQHAKSK
jgi:hypothetical protein